MRKRFLVYDFPIRVFHWLFVSLFVGAFGIAKFIEDSSRLFQYHMMLGLTLLFLIVCRVLWGIVGTRYAKFESFALNPRLLFNYMNDVRKGTYSRWVGHNPASSWAGLIMMGCGVTSAISGAMMTSGLKSEWFEEIHEISANTFLVVAAMHVLGIVIHTVRHKELIGLSMVDGKKERVFEGEQISSAYWGMGILLGCVVLLFGFYLNKNYDSQTGKLEAFGFTLQLKEDNNTKM